MKIVKGKKKTTVTLGRECTIAAVEADTEKIKSVIDATKRIEIKADGVEEMDTAYFQLLLSIMVSSKESGAGFSIKGMSDVVKDIFDLYGVSYS